MPSRPRQPSSQDGLGDRAGALAEQLLSEPGELGDLDRLRGRADDLHLAVDELEVFSRHLELLRGEVEQLLAHLSGRLDDRAPVVHGLRARGARVEGAASVSW